MKRSIFAITFTLLLSACSSTEPEQVLRGNTMGTTWSVKYIGAPTIQQQVIQRYLDDFNQIMSTYIKDSEISKINRAPINQWLDVSAELNEIVQLSLEVSQQSQGAFDITVGKAVNYWGFGAEENEQQPRKRDIGYQYIQLNDSKLYKEKNIYLDLSAIAKGHAVDKVGALLESAQINRYLVEIGGEILAKGKNKKNAFWTIAIEQPNPLKRTIMHTIELKNQAIASSGSYRNFKQKNNQIISHTIDPKTAKPITHNVLASSVISHSAALADAYATAFMVLPINTSVQLSNQQGFATLIISGDMGDSGTFETHHSSHFNAYLNKGE